MHSATVAAGRGTTQTSVLRKEKTQGSSMGSEKGNDACTSRMGKESKDKEDDNNASQLYGESQTKVKTK
jgi:hypothetical protein